MTTIKDLPEEIIALILMQQNINTEDIRNFSCTCKQFHQYIQMQSNKAFWIKKCSQSWPSAKRAYDEQREHKTLHDDDFIKQIKENIKSIKGMWCYISNMSKKYYFSGFYDTDMQDFDLKFQVFDKHKCSLNIYIVMDELIKSVFIQSPREPGCDLTRRYYSIRVLIYLLQFTLRRKWEKFINQPKKKQLLEIMAIFIMQWCQPNKYISFLYISEALNKITQEVLKYLKKEYPEHSIFTTSAEQFSFWEYNNINESCWNETEANQIIYILDKIIFNLNTYKLDYPWNISDQIEDYMTNLEKNADFYLFLKNFFFLITYHSVARRLGIHCRLVQHLAHRDDLCLFHIAWKPRNTNKNKYFYIKQEFGLLVKKQCYISYRIDNLPLEITIPRLSFMHKITMSPSVSIVDVRMKLEMELYNAILSKKQQFKERPEEIKFAVGMIVTHNDINNKDNKAGVIIGWYTSFDIKLIMYKCAESRLSRCKYFKSSTLEDRDPHAYYFILHDNNELCYIAQCMNIKTAYKNAFYKNIVSLHKKRIPN